MMSFVIERGHPRSLLLKLPTGVEGPSLELEFKVVWARHKKQYHVRGSVYDVAQLRQGG